MAPFCDPATFYVFVLVLLDILLFPVRDPTSNVTVKSRMSLCDTFRILILGSAALLSHIGCMATWVFIWKTILFANKGTLFTTN